ncbi:complement factor H-related protein 5 isoform X2 [Ornithorhynchus anatinus]|uniref:complement factor H-related protein 5 isoform X2 n=1 Tax=Ornithorhynchus anatinus TaxID=9258 RepID=UPI0010A892F3|nr:complement factor H-related protein 5 isoform X2 [Ornithorhynchus anatinus]
MKFLQRIVFVLSWTYCAAQGNCKKLYINNGHFSETNESYNVNEIAQYRCIEGYTTPEGTESGELKCLQKGWSVQPICIKTCKRPEFRNARYEGNEILFQLNSELEYDCLDGYIRREGRSTTDSIVCGEDGWSHIPECHEIECDIPDLTPNIRAINGKDKYKVGDVLSFICQNRQKRVGPDSIQCYHFGWSPDPPTCQEVVKPCGPLPTLANGKSNKKTEKRAYRHGEVVEYKCDAKFIMEGSKRIECRDGKWTPLPACKEVEKTCGNPPELNHGDLKSNHPPPYHHGDSVEYSCQEAFTVIGKKKVTCIQGTWTALPQCIEISQLKKCTVPPDPSNGKITSTKSDYPHNSFLFFICNANFEAEESTRIPCINGKWQQLPTCLSKGRRKLCPPPPQIPHAQMISTTVSYVSGETLSVRCEDGYLLQGPEEIKCENGVWKFVPHCVKAGGKCGPPPAIDNGDIISFPLLEYPPGAKVEYKCQNLYKLEGSKQVACRNGKWSKPPSCLEACTASPEDMVRNNIELKWSDSKKLYTETGEVIEFTCKLGFMKAPGSPSFQAQCLQGRIIYPKCIEGLPCGKPLLMLNGFTSDETKEIYQTGEEVTYQCLEGFEISGSPNVKCEGGEWSIAPKCTAVGKCGPPPPIDNGDITSFLFAEYLSGSQVEYRCRNLYTLEGFQRVICINGKWSNPPSCLDHSCGSPPSVKNAFIFRNEKIKYQPGERVRYKCIGGLSMFGDADILCKNRTWTNAPECKEAFGKCGPPPPIDNGDITSFLFAEYPSGAQVEYECQDLYKLEGSKDVRCENGKWSNPPLCLEAFGKCGPPPPIDNGDITSFLFAEYPTGAQVEYECQDLYKLEGSKDVRCENGKWSNPPLCLDACTASSEAMLRNNIKLKWKNRKIFSETGDLIEFTCKMGFMKAPGSPPFRVQCLQGKLTYPECVKR